MNGEPREPGVNEPNDDAPVERLQWENERLQADLALARERITALEAPTEQCPGCGQQRPKNFGVKMCSECIHAVHAKHEKMRRIIAGLRRAIIVLASDRGALLDPVFGDGRIDSLDLRASAIRNAARRGEYRKP